VQRAVVLRVKRVRADILDVLRTTSSSKQLNPNLNFDIHVLPSKYQVEHIACTPQACLISPKPLKRHPEP
jgi:hypothetical protein